MNIPTATSNNNEYITDWIDEHYKEMSQRAKPIEAIDVFNKMNPNYWLHKPRNKHNIVQQATYRNLEIDNYGDDQAKKI